jgi:hypothetical protein
VDHGETPCEALESLPASGVERFERMAVDLLWHWTGRRYGQCEGTIRPCRQDCTAGVSTYGSSVSAYGRRVVSPWAPALVGGDWFNVGCGAGCGDLCGCGAWGSTLRLDVPAYEVVSIEVDGEVLPSGSYRVDDRRLLVRQDGGRWPYCQDMGLPLGEPGTWAVTLRVGAPVPVGGQVAAGRLACELAKAATGKGKCELPNRVQSVTRQGVTVSMMIDTFDDLDQGRTGIWTVDSWVASVTKPDIGFSIASPDLRPTGRRTTWPRGAT